MISFPHLNSHASKARSRPPTHENITISLKAWRGHFSSRDLQALRLTCYLLFPIQKPWLLLTLYFWLLADHNSNQGFCMRKERWRVKRKTGTKMSSPGLQGDGQQLNSGSVDFVPLYHAVGKELPVKVMSMHALRSKKTKTGGTGDRCSSEPVRA